jgi:presenilin-like A22 family membrane protease
MSLFLCLGISKPLSLRTGLILPYMLKLNSLLLYVSMFLLFFNFIIFNKKKKNWGRRCRIFILLRVAFQVLYVFLPDISVHCALIEYDYI